MPRTWKYWVGRLILGGHGYPHSGTNGPRIDRPVSKADSTMPVSNRTHYGILTNDIKQVEWYAAQYKAWGVAVYCEPYDDDDEDVERLPVYRGGKFIGRLYDPADAELAQSELDERDRRVAECRRQAEADAVKAAERREIIKARCAKSGCAMRPFGHGCPRSEHDRGGCVELIKYYRMARDEETETPANRGGRATARVNNL
jgi:hypothetical protein